MRYLICLLLLLSGCAYQRIDYPITQATMSQANEIYSNNYKEVSFCIGKVRGVYNVNVGDLFRSGQAICINSVSCHTHPAWALEPFHNFIDEAAWDEYTEAYGNTVFAVMYGKDDIRFYQKKIGD